MSAKAATNEELKITVGCDPEFFYYNEMNKRFEWPGHVPGSKAAPFHVKNGAIQVDGLAIELNIIPATTEDEFVTRLESVMDFLTKNYVEKNAIKIIPTAEFVPYYMNLLESHVVELGCIPDLDAYTQKENPRPNKGRPDKEQFLRTAAGHIHAGWWHDQEIALDDPNHRADCFEVVKQLDYYIGLPSLLWDKDNKRRSLYGKAGACRIKSYGVEYRTPSNQWLLDKELQKFIFRNTVKAIQDLNNGKRVFEMYGNLAQDLINSGTTPDPSFGPILYPDLPEKYRNFKLPGPKAKVAIDKKNP